LTATILGWFLRDRDDRAEERVQEEPTVVQTQLAELYRRQAELEFEMLMLWRREQERERAELDPSTPRRVSSSTSPFRATPKDSQTQPDCKIARRFLRGG
jgi:hypothetical protein